MAEYSSSKVVESPYFSNKKASGVHDQASGVAETSESTLRQSPGAAGGLQKKQENSGDNVDVPDPFFVYVKSGINLYEIRAGSTKSSVADALYLNKENATWQDVIIASCVLKPETGNEKITGCVNMGIPVEVICGEKFRLIETQKCIKHRSFKDTDQIYFFNLLQIRSGNLTGVALKDETICVPFTNGDSLLGSLYKDGRFNKETLQRTKLFNESDLKIPLTTCPLGPKDHKSVKKISCHGSHRKVLSDEKFEELKKKWDSELNPSVNIKENMAGSMSASVKRVTLKADNDSTQETGCSDQVEHPKIEDCKVAERKQVNKTIPNALIETFCIKLLEKFNYSDTKQNRRQARHDLMQNENFYNRLSRPMKAETISNISKMTPYVCSLFKEDDMSLHGGTGFYIGNKLILTCYHVLKHLHDEGPVPFNKPLNHQVCFEMDYDKPSPQKTTRAGKIIAFSVDSEMDYAFIEIEKNIFEIEPKFTFVADPGKEEYNQVNIVGFPLRAHEKLVDLGCTMVGHDELIYYCTQFPNMNLPFKEQLSYHSSFFQGSSGSPVMNDLGNIIAMHRKGFYPDPTETVKLYGIPSKYEAGTLVTSIFNHAKANFPEHGEVLQFIQNRPESKCADNCGIFKQSSEHVPMDMDT